MTREVDVLIVTALKLEFEQVLKVSDGADEPAWSEERGPLGLDVAFRSFRCEGGKLRVAVTWATDMGAVAATTAAIPLVEKYKPRCIAMCGVCAGRPGKVELGDVIIADRLFHYEAGKVVREKNEEGTDVERLEGDALTYNLTPDWKQRAERFVVDPLLTWLGTRPAPYAPQERWALSVALKKGLTTGHPERKARCPDWKAVLERLWARGLLAKNKLTLTPEGRAFINREHLLHPDGFSPDKAFAVHVGPIGTGSKVVEDPAIWGRLSESSRKVLGIEMEAFAIGAIAHAQVGRSMRAIVMKAAMDVANPDRDDRYKTFAARASAEVLLRFLRDHLEPGLQDMKPTPAPGVDGAPPVALKAPVRLATRRSEQELIGRDQMLKDVRTALEDGAFRGVALHGITGVGKTSIAETLGATDYERGLYPGGVFEVTGTSEDLFLTGLATLGDALGAPKGTSEEQKVGVARRRLAQSTERTLFIIDDIDPTAPWVERELRSLPACVRLLVTLTVWPIGFLNGPGRARWIEVPSLTPEGAHALVKSLAPFLDDSEIARLNAILNGYTLGLEVAARTLASEPMLGVEGYLTSLKAARERRGDGATEREQSALSALEVLWEHLPEAARRVWAICGAFDAAPVPDGWLKHALAEARMSEGDARSGTGELLKRHLATRIIDNGDVSLRFHPIVHTFSRLVASVDDRRAMAIGITRWFDGTWDSEVNLHFKTRMTLPHVEATLQNAKDDPRVLRRLAVALRTNNRQESLGRALAMLRDHLASDQNEQDDGTDATEWIRHELARVLIVRDTSAELLEAETLLRHVLQRRDARTAGSTADLVVTLNDLSGALAHLGESRRTAEAEQLRRRAIQMVAIVSDTGEIRAATLMSNLAVLLRSEGGHERLREAERLARRALQIEEAALGSHSPSVANSLVNLAGVLESLGGQEHLQEAETLARRAVRIEETVLGYDTPTIAVSLSNLADILVSSGGREHFDEAEQLLRRALRISETARGSNAHQIAWLLNSLATVLVRLGGMKGLMEAEKHMRRAFTIDRATFPHGSPTTANIEANLAGVLRQLGGQTRIREAQRLETAARKSNRRTAPRKGGR